MSRRRRRGVYLLCILLTASVVWIDRYHAKPLRKKISRTFSSDDFARYHEREVTVINIVDGDTIDIDVPDGKYDHTRIRLLGLDTPETKQPGKPVMYYGQEAADFAKSLVLNKKVTLIMDKLSGPRGKYGRLLAHIKMHDGRILNRQLIAQGYAYADLRFPNEDYQAYIDLQTKAIRSKTGLWKEVTFKQLPPWLQREKPNILE